MFLTMNAFFCRASYCFLFIVCLLACKQMDTTPAEENTDTRILVQQVYDSIDYHAVSVIFNQRKAEELKVKMDAEQDPTKRVNIAFNYAVELLRAGKTSDAIEVFGVLSKYLQQHKVPLESNTKRQFLTHLAITFMRHGEIQNCIHHHNHESCVIPVKGNGVHDLRMGSENAIQQYLNILAEYPDDLESMYLLNLAYMTLGQYPDQVPAKYRIDPSWFSSSMTIKPFDDIASRLGLNKRSHGGGSVIEDFNNDGWPDILITSWGPSDTISLFINDGKGNFKDLTTAWGLTGQAACLQVTKADYNNDGWVDLLLLRGAWYQQEGDLPRTLLMNTGKGSFTDVTIKAGLTKRAPTQAAAWTDVNLDGWVDVVIANESLEGYERGIDLYLNKKDGTFTHASAAYGLTKHSFYKGITAADVNDDRYPDLYVSSIADGNMLFINEDAGGGNRKFTASTAKVKSPLRSFPCWSFDYNNDGREDLFVSGYDNSLPPAKYWMQSKQGTVDKEFLPKLYANRGNLQFDEVGLDMGLNEVAFTMGCNFGDINADGFLDMFLGTGNPAYQSLVPNKMYLNIEGKRFEDVSYSGGFANVQKGHGVSFGDLDHDGDEDIYIVMGGAFDGDFYYNSLFENPNEDKNNWLVLDLEGTTANKKAIGARVAITVEENGKERMIHRTVTSGSSFGGNSFILEVGLRKAEKVMQVVVQWPCISCPVQTFTGMEINSAYKLREGSAQAQPMTYQPVRFGSSGHDEHVQ
jgi:hypothetical protein